MICHTCQNVKWDERHRCPPLFKVRDKDGSERTVYAYDHEDAATTWAERDDADSADYAILSGQEAEVVVTDDAGVAKKFIVRGESQPSYEAEEVEEPAVKEGA